MYKAFHDYVPRMATPEMTAELENDMDQIAAGETSKDEVLRISREMLHSTTAALEDQQRGLREADLGGDGRGQVPRPCKVCEEAGRKHEDGSPNRLRIIDLKGGKRMYGCEGWNRDDPDVARLLPGQRPAARPRLRALAARGALLGLRRAPAADGQGLPRPALEALPQRRLPDDGRDAREARRAPGGQGGARAGEGRRRGQRRRRPARPRRPPTRHSAKAKGGATPPAPQEALAADGADEAGALEQADPADGVFVTLEGIDRSGKTTQAALLAEALGPDTLLAARARRHACRRADPRAAEGPELELGPRDRAAPVQRGPGRAVPRGRRARRSTTDATSSATGSSTPPSPTRASARGLGVERCRAAERARRRLAACRTSRCCCASTRS